MKSYNEAKQSPNRVAATLLIAIAYFVCGSLAMQWAFPVGYLPAIFPAAGIAVSAVFIIGPRAYLGVFIGSFSLNIWLAYSSGKSLASAEFMASLLTATANVIQAAVGGWSLRRVLGYPCSFDKTREILFFLLLTPLFCLISVSITISATVALGLIDSAQVLQGWLIFWLGNAIGVLLVLPLVLTLVGEPRPIWRRRRLTVALPLLIAAALFTFAFNQAIRREEIESLNYLSMQIGWHSWTVLLFGVLGTGLLDAFLLLSSGHAARVEMEVERKVLELRESTEKLRALFELSPLGITLVDTEGDYIELNKSFEKITGYTAEELKNIDYLSYVPPQQRANSKEQFLRALQSGPHGPLEREYRRKDGALVPISVYYTSITGKDGKQYLWSIVEDISERKRTERALQESEERWQFALEGAGDGIWDIDVAKEEMFLSAQAMAMLGYERQARRITTDEWKTFIHPEDLPCGQEILAKCIENKVDFYVFDFRARTQDGQWRWLRRRGKLIGSLPNGLPARMIGTHTDIHYERQQKNRDRLHSTVMEMLAGGAGLTAIAQAITDALHSADRDLIYVVFSKHQNHLSMIATNIFAAELSNREFPLGSPPKSSGTALRDGKIIQPPTRANTLWQSFATFAAEVGITPCWMELITGKADDIKAALVAFNCISTSTTLPDIDDLKQAAGLIDTALQHNEMDEQVQLIASVYEASSEGIMVTDGGGRILAVNPAFTAITGFAPDDVIGHANEMLRTASEQEGPYPEARESIRKTGHWKGEILGHRKNGEPLPTGITINTIWDADGKVARRVCIFSDITEKKMSEERMQYLATHDTLTELPNRLLFHDRLQHALAHAQRENSQLALLYIDLDHFKPVNDTLGHCIGDQLLRAVATRMQTCVREADTIARIGGDEFVVLLPEIKSHAETLAVADKIKLRISEPFEISGNFIAISASLGVATFPDDGENETELSLHADVAMYYAKQQGRNTVGTYQATNAS